MNICTQPRHVAPGTATEKTRDHPLAWCAPHPDGAGLCVCVCVCVCAC